MNTEKLIRQLFVGKVAEIIGMEKTLELLKEATYAIRGASKSKKKPASDGFFVIYYKQFDMNMYYSLLKKRGGGIEENYVSHPYRAIVFTKHLVEDKLSEMQEQYPMKEWHIQPYDEICR